MYSSEATTSFWQAPEVWWPGRRSCRQSWGRCCRRGQSQCVPQPHPPHSHPWTPPATSRLYTDKLYEREAPTPEVEVNFVSLGNKVLIYKEHRSVCPLVGIGTLPPLLSPASVPLPPETGGGGHARLRVGGWGSPNSDDWRKSLALCLLCALGQWIRWCADGLQNLI